MDIKKENNKKAELFFDLHYSNELLVLPNIWDVLGAKLLEKSGYEAIATASASIAFANGYDDGQNISFENHLAILSDIVASTHLPVSADIERGYSNDNQTLKENIINLIKCGIVGINIEDSMEEGGQLRPIDDQCERIRLIKKTAEKEGALIFINARTDTYLAKLTDLSCLAATIERGQAYKNAGADGFYPVLAETKDLKQLNEQVDLPMNVFATSEIYPMKELEKLGIARLSLGPSLLKAALTRMQEVLKSLKNYEDYSSFTNNVISSSDIVKMIQKPQV